MAPAMVATCASETIKGPEATAHVGGEEAVAGTWAKQRTPDAAAKPAPGKKAMPQQRLDALYSLMQSFEVCL